MARLNLSPSKRDSASVSEVYENIVRRIKFGSGGACPVETVSAFIRLSLADSCGKCNPCKNGLSQLYKLNEKVLNGEADENTLTLMKMTASVVALTSACAIGMEGGRNTLAALSAFRDEYHSHIKSGACISHYETAVPCVGLCPAHVDIPGYIALVREQRFADAVKLIRKDNPLPSVCALTCEHPCENHCRRGLVDDAVNIRALKRMAVDNAGDVSRPEAAPPTGKKVAVIGGGPSGLTAAYYLTLMGHGVTVFEQKKQLGGMLRYGIPAYRLPREILDNEIKSILSVGIKAETNVKIGRDISFDEIRKTFDAVYISIGAHDDNKLGIEDENAPGVISAVDMLGAIGDGEMPDFTGKRVLVIGGGNVAMDCTRTSVRLGAERVICAYRRRKEDMTALPEEIEGAVEEGCEIKTLVAPEKIEKDENGKISAMWMRPQMISTVSRGRPGVVDSGEESIRISADIIIVAIGQKIDSLHFAESSVPVNRGAVTADDACCIKELEGVFAGGDCVTGPATAIKAIAAGKTAAASIDSYLGFCHEISVDVDIPRTVPGIAAPCGRINLPERAAAHRKHDFNLMEKKMTLKQCLQESGRCLNCSSNGFGAFKGGRTTKW